MSLRIRLILWFTAVLAVALVVLGFLVFTLVSQELSAEVDASVQNKAHDLAISARFVNQQVTVPVRVQVPDSEFRTPTLYSEIRDTTGQAVYRSDTLLGGDLPASETALASARSNVPTFETVKQSGQSIRLYTAPILANGHLIGYVQAGRNLSDIDAALGHLRSRLLASAGLVLVFAATGGWLLAHLALRPMDRIGQEARAIGLARRLDRRLPVPAVADEVGRLATTFNEMLDRLEAAFDAQQRFVADASHELRTPLTTIQGNVDFLRRNPDLPVRERTEALSDVADEVRRMGRLVNGLLALARADAGPQLARVPVELRPILEACAQKAQALARPAGIDVELSVDGLARGASVLGDADRLSEMVMALLENAVKYNRPDGTVRLENAVKYNRPDGTVRLNATTRDGRHQIAVQDTGWGIAATDLPHVFERFYRSASSRGEDGTGLGLAIAQWIAQEHDATISVDSVPDRGSTFAVSLPVARPALAAVS